MAREHWMYPILQVCLQDEGDGGYTPVPQTCFVSILSWPPQPWWDNTRSLLCHLDHFVLCAEGSAYPVFVFQVHVPLAVACACMHAHACSRCHLASPGRRCLLSGCCEPGMLMSSVTCLLMLLWGPLLCFFVPKLLPLRQSGVSGSVCSLPVCTSLFLRLSVLPPHPLDSLTFRRAQPAPGTGSFLTPCRPLFSLPTLPVSSHGVIFSS